jgi:ketosteroid isomerase-like protein
VKAVRFVSADVALVDGEAVIEGFRTTAGTVMPPLRHRFTDVLVKEDARWLVAHVRAYIFMPRPDA